jgi:hypothetical protein
MGPTIALPIIPTIMVISRGAHIIEIIEIIERRSQPRKLREMVPTRRNQGSLSRSTQRAFHPDPYPDVKATRLPKARFAGWASETLLGEHEA